MAPSAASRTAVAWPMPVVAPVVKLPIHDRRIGIELSDLRSIPKVVGVAGGINKAQAILGALRGGFLDVLVTNELAAIRLLELERRAQRGTSRKR
jgi:DNA-binding transcriptional regulator LsrR (DeoR family)